MNAMSSTLPAAHLTAAELGRHIRFPVSAVHPITGRLAQVERGQFNVTVTLGGDPFPWVLGYHEQVAVV